MTDSNPGRTGAQTRAKPARRNCSKSGSLSFAYNDSAQCFLFPQKYGLEKIGDVSPFERLLEEANKLAFG